MNNDFSIIDHEKKEDYRKDFDKIAKVLLNQTKLIVNENSYLIREIEFYYYCANHTDFYCHKNDRQLKYNRLYFHRFKDPGKYMRLKQKGLDLTIGNDSSIYGGILIRAIENAKTNMIYTGIGNLTNQIISDIGGAFVIQEVYNEDKSNFDPSSLIHLEASSDNGLTIFKQQRQGLNLKKEDSENFYFNSKYNYFTYPVIELLK